MSGYDRVSAGLLAALLVTAWIAGILLMFWLEGGPATRAPFSPPLQQGALVPVAGQDRSGTGWAEPGLSEFPQVERPRLANRLQSLTSAVVRVNGLSDGTGRNGDGRKPGPSLGPVRQAAEAERRQVAIEATTRAGYLEIPDHFGITLGVVESLSNRIHHADRLTSGPEIREGQRSAERRLFFMNSRSHLRPWDRITAQNAQIETKNALVGHFYPEPLRQLLLALEAEVYSADGKTLADVKRTRLVIRDERDGPGFFVESIDYRSDPAARRIASAMRIASG